MPSESLNKEEASLSMTEDFTREQILDELDFNPTAGTKVKIHGFEKNCDCIPLVVPCEGGWRKSGSAAGKWRLVHCETRHGFYADYVLATYCWEPK